MNKGLFQRVLDKVFSQAGVAVEVILPSDRSFTVGSGQSVATITAKTQTAARQLLGLNENAIAESYINGDLDIEGSFKDLLATRSSLKKRHGLALIKRFALPAFFGQLFSNKKAISKHYELDPDFYLSFLDKQWPAYTQGVYQHQNETLSVATERKFEFATESCEIGGDSHILEVGPGWGAYAKYVLPKGARMTALTISPQSKRYLENLLPSEQFRVLDQDFLSYAPKDKYDAVSIMGVMEHLPQYNKVCRQLKKILKPGGRAYIDASASRKKYALSQFIYKHIFPYNHSFLHLDGFLKAAKEEDLELVSLHDDSKSYQYTIENWARNLEASRTHIQKKFGDYHFRRFRLYLWGSVQGFIDDSLQCHRLVLQAP